MDFVVSNPKKNKNTYAFEQMEEKNKALNIGNS
jgi:hypothetical protein